MAAPRANDDYEDRLKEIFTSELAKSGDKEKKAKVTLSPTIEEISSDDDNEHVEINQEAETSCLKKSSFLFLYVGMTITPYLIHHNQVNIPYNADN